MRFLDKLAILAGLSIGFAGLVINNVAVMMVGGFIALVAVIDLLRHR